MGAGALSSRIDVSSEVGGVLLGIVVGELLHGLLGESTAALGLIVLATMVIALAVGVGFFGDGMMFPNQAAASAILVVTVHRHGTGAERGVDALVDGAVALVLGVGLFPAQPGATVDWVAARMSTTTRWSRRSSAASRVTCSK